MKLDEGIADQKLALDITPLIDIVFLLVLFFAVTTSFISPEKLDQLKGNLVSLSDDKERLGQELTGLQAEYAQNVAAKKAEIEKLLGEIDTEQGRTEKLRWMMAALEKDKDSIEKTLADSKDQNQSLQSQLEQAYDDYKLLNIKVKGMQDDAAREAAQKALLESLLAEKAAEIKAKSNEIDTQKQQLSLADQARLALRSQLAAQQQQAGELNEKLSEAEQAQKALQGEIASQQQQAAALNQKLSLAEQARLVLLGQIDDQKEQATALTKELTEKQQAQLVLQAQLNQLEKASDEKAVQERMLQALLAERAERNASLSQQLAQATASIESTTSELNTLKQTQTRTAANSEALRTTILRLETELAKYRKIADLDRGQIERILKAQENLRAGLGAYLENNQLDIKRDQQKLTVQLSNKILFDSGSAQLKPAGLEVLRTVGKILRSRIAELNVQIAGHTDNVPIAGKSGILGSNWGLSAARAVNVVRFFEHELKLDPDRLSAVGYGEYQPVASNDTAEGRAANRRIEIVLVPR